MIIASICDAFAASRVSRHHFCDNISRSRTAATPFPTTTTVSTHYAEEKDHEEARQYRCDVTLLQTGFETASADSCRRRNGCCIKGCKVTRKPSEAELEAGCRQLGGCSETGIIAQEKAEAQEAQRTAAPTFQEARSPAATKERLQNDGHQWQSRANRNVRHSLVFSLVRSSHCREHS